MKFIRKVTFMFVLAVFLVNLSIAKAIFESCGKQESDNASNIQLKKGEAAVWYLFHSGWVVKTFSALMIFDYLPDGFINPNEIKDQNVYVFISHGHGDHFDRNIMKWIEVIPNITYIFGWQAREAQGHHAFGKERLSRSIGPLKVKNISHSFDNIPESAFLIEVDGLTIYFSGDHGNAPGALNPVYKDNIDYMSQQSDGFDLVFLSVFGSPTYDSELYAIDKFKPRVMLPMHYGGRESMAERFVALARSKFPETEFWYPLNMGDRFLYKKGEISPLK